ncbi:hypothetical protein ACRHK7_06185 [Weissella tructae]|uniref:Uncharacterized protein n=2 Tax=Weissella TaxID=46255 RepID=A0A075TVH7_9LACO|nr:MULTISPECIES: hypothetical protein [Weissella]AIG65564.1 hypothetical protein WS08_0625 [Weissella tructae]AIM62878.1 hypothetical protein WS74_0626 [Weissella ceti]AIM64276.1 hypothetical protein WS105_0686 [Weissella ceti]ELA06978.1 hypothetical protein WCNC_05342 [Weissella ceti NC36]QVV90696.1 hypothetical protein KHQ32_03400 [Weissella tructae]
MILGISFWCEALPNWLAAIGTVGAVLFAVRYSRGKAKLEINAVYTYIDEFTHASEDGTFVKSGESFKKGDRLDWDGWNISLSVFVSNSGESSALVDRWGVVVNGQEHIIESIPKLVKGHDVLELTVSSDTEKHLLDKDYYGDVLANIRDSKDVHVFVKFHNYKNLQQKITEKNKVFEEH